MRVLERIFMDFSILSETGAKKEANRSEFGKEILTGADNSIFTAGEFTGSIFDIPSNSSKNCSTNNFTGKRLDFES